MEEAETVRAIHRRIDHERHQMVLIPVEAAFDGKN